MRRLRRFFKRLSSWTKKQRDEERLRAEIEEHLALQTAENLRAGLSLVEAQRQAVLKFGAVEAMREDYRDQRGLPFMEASIQDTRHALRRLRNAPAFTITTILTLALGIGWLIGLPLTFAAGRFLGNQLYGMNPYNPVVTLIAVATLGVSALAASLIPAFRASLISPLEALRAE